MYSPSGANHQMGYPVHIPLNRERYRISSFKHIGVYLMLELLDAVFIRGGRLQESSV